MMLLAHHWNSFGIMQFDETSGVVGSKVEAAGDQAEWGFLWQQRGLWYAIRKDHSGLIFQHGSRKWHSSDGVELHVNRGMLLREFKVQRTGSVEFRLRYFFGGFIQALIDPCYDEFNEERDDFFYFVCEVWSGWKNRLPS